MDIHGRGSLNVYEDQDYRKFRCCEGVNFTWLVK